MTQHTTSNETERENLRMDAYYYSFEPTGVIEIDRVLSAVACAGKGCHSTEDWREYGLDAAIQTAANEAASAWQAARASLPKARTEPVAWGVSENGKLVHTSIGKESSEGWLQYAPAERALVPLFAAPPMQVAPIGKIIAWCEKDDDKWHVHDADSETGQHITLYQKDTHYISVFPIFSALVPQVAPEQASDIAITISSVRELDELLGSYWEIAYSEGETGQSRGSEAQAVLNAIRALISEEAT